MRVSIGESNMKILVISMMFMFGSFAVAANNIPASEAEGHYRCSGTKNQVRHDIGVVIETNNKKTTVTYYQEEMEGTVPYSRTSFQHDGNSGFYKLTLGGIKFGCSRLF